GQRGGSGIPLGPRAPTRRPAPPLRLAGPRQARDWLQPPSDRADGGGVDHATRARARREAEDGMWVFCAAGAEVAMNELLAKSPQGGRRLTLLQHIIDVMDAAEWLFGVPGKLTRLGLAWLRFF